MNTEMRPPALRMCVDRMIQQFLRPPPGQVSFLTDPVADALRQPIGLLLSEGHFEIHDLSNLAGECPCQGLDYARALKIQAVMRVLASC